AQRATTINPVMPRAAALRSAQIDPSAEQQADLDPIIAGIAHSAEARRCLHVDARFRRARGSANLRRLFRLYSIEKCYARTASAAIVIASAATGRRPRWRGRASACCGFPEG